MKIYLDYIFLENFVINLITYFVTIKIINVKINRIKQVLISILNSIISCLCLIFKLNNYLILFAITVFEIIIMSQNKRIKCILKNITLYYLTYFILIGLIIVLTILFNINLSFFAFKISLYLICGMIDNLFINNLWKMWKIMINENNLTYYIRINNNIIPIFVDTGNTVKDIFTNLDVMFISSKYKELMLSGYSNLKKKKVLVTSVNNINWVDGFIFKNVEIYKNNIKVATIEKIIISFEFNNTQEKYSGIIGYETYLKYLEGVNLC